MTAVWFILTVPTAAYQKSRFRDVSSVKCGDSSVNKTVLRSHPLSNEATSSSGKIDSKLTDGWLFSLFFNYL